MWISLLFVFGIALLLQALFAGYEAGFISLNPIRIRYMAEEEKSRAAALMLKYMRHSDNMVTTLLIGTNVAVVVGSLAMTSLVGSWLPDALHARFSELLATLITAPVLLVFAEIIPKTVFRLHAAKLTLFLLPVIRVVHILLAVISWPVTWLTRLVLPKSNGDPTAAKLLSNIEDMRTLVDESAHHGTIEPEEREMIHSVIDLQSCQAKEIMVPRIDIQALPDSAKREELIALFEETGRTRIPIYKDSIDTIIGIANAFDVLTDVETNESGIAKFIKPAMHVPDTMKADDLLRAFRQEKQHMAIVTDEYGGTDGLITAEDIIEEIFGEILDEYDVEERAVQRVGPNAFVLDARMALEDLSEELGLPLVDDEVETVGGWLMRIAGRIPRPGQMVTHGRYRITVLEGGPSAITRIRLDLLPEPEPPQESVQG